MAEEHSIQIRVRYCETDAMGFLHHSHFINYFEQGRTELLRAQGGRYRDIEEAGLFLVVVRLQCHYHSPAHYDDLLTLITTISNISAVKIEHSYRLLCGEFAAGFDPLQTVVFAIRHAANRMSRRL